MNPLTSIALAVAVVAGVAVVSRLGLALGDRLPGDRASWHAATFHFATTLALAGGLLAFHTSELGSLVAEAVFGAPSAPAAAVTTAGAATLTALLGLAVRTRTWNSDAYPGERGFVRAPGASADRRVWAAIASAAFLAALVIELAGWNALGLAPYWLLAAPVGCYFLYSLAVVPVQPPHNHWFAAAREPTERERERIADCYDRFGRAPGSVVVTTGGGARWLALAAGRLAGRYLWIHESLLADASDDVLTAALAIHEERGRRGYFTALLFPLVPVSVGVIVGVGRLLQTADPWAAIPPMVAAVTAVVAGAAVAGRLSDRAEAVATETVGHDAVRRTYEDFGSATTVVAFQRLGALPLPRWLNPETPTAWSVLRVPATRDRPYDPPTGGLGWLVVGSSLFAPLGLAATEIALRVAHTEGHIGAARLRDVVEHFVPLLYVLLLLTPFVALYGLHRQRGTAGPGEWSPHVAYYAVGVPLLSPLVALVYLLERTYRTHWDWLPAEASSG